MTGMRLLAARPLTVLVALSLMAGVCTIARADDALVDTRIVPRLDGAVGPDRVAALIDLVGDQLPRFGEHEPRRAYNLLAGLGHR